MNGSYNLFNNQGGPQKSVNFIVAHDGFTLMDLVSYNQKENWYDANQERGGPLWPFGPSDGGNDSNESWDSTGFADLELKAFRRQRLRNFWVIQMFSRGIPMSVSGDELGRTQNGNNNPYKINSIGIWNNYEMVGTNAPLQVPAGDGGSFHDNYGIDENPSGKNGLFLFVKDLINIRNTHGALRQNKYGNMQLNDDDDVTYMFKKEDWANDVRNGDNILCF